MTNTKQKDGAMSDFIWLTIMCTSMWLFSGLVLSGNYYDKCADDGYFKTVMNKRVECHINNTQNKDTDR